MIITQNRYLSLLLIFGMIIIYPEYTYSGSTDTLAIVGNKILTAAEFRARYSQKINEIGFKDSYEVREEYLKNLIADELLIAKAKLLKLDATDNAVTEFERIQLQELLNEYTTSEISAKIVVNENELFDLYQKMNTKLSVSHLYAPTIQEADLLYRRLLNGEDFNELAKECFDDPLLKNNEGYLGYISIDEMDPAFEETSYSLEINQISKPVKTTRGYSIIKLNDIKSNPLTTEQEFLKVKNKLMPLARKRKFERYVEELTAAMTKDLEINFNDQMVDLLYASMRKSDNYYIEDFSIPELNEIILSSKLGDWDLAYVIKESRLTTEKFRNWVRTPENFREFLAGIVTRKYIWMQALNKGLHQSKLYKENIQFQFDTYLMQKIEEQLEENIVIPSDDIQKFYLDNKNYFRSSPKIRISSILIDDKGKLSDVQSRLHAGESFALLAKKYSIQTNTANNGGDMGFFEKSDLDELADTLFNLSLGEWTGPFESNNQYAFLKVTNKIPQSYYTLEESSSKIRENLTAQKKIEMRQSYIEELKEKISVESFPDKLRKLKIN